MSFAHFDFDINTVSHLLYILNERVFIYRLYLYLSFKILSLLFFLTKA